MCHLRGAGFDAGKGIVHKQGVESIQVTADTVLSDGFFVFVIKNPDFPDLFVPVFDLFFLSVFLIFVFLKRKMPAPIGVPLTF